MLSGCASDPFQRAPLPELNNPDVSAIPDQFIQAIPSKFTSDDTVIIQAPFRDDMAILAVLSVDRQAGTYDLYGLSLAGLELFHLAGDRNGAEIRSAVPMLMEHENVLHAIGEDIRRMYLDLAPKMGACADVQSKIVTYTQETDNDGTIVYEFGGEPIMLLDKHRKAVFGSAWRVRYYDYRESNGKLYPRGVVMDNGAYHYRIIVKNRDWTERE
jgi:hypothetical protein